VHEADEEAFEDHWGSVHTSLEEWRHFMTAAHYDPALWFVVWDGDEIAGISLCNAGWTGDPGLGWVNVLGVRRPWRRRGLALALLLHSFHELEARGMDRVALGVDAESLTGAVRLYEKAGMRVVRQSDTWEKPLSALTGSDA
jgi:ribosomal protein S18 acetylase RimI-like enzyme